MNTRHRFALILALAVPAATALAAFQPEEATIAGMQGAIRDGRTTCVEVVQAHLARARAYNGVCTALVTGDGKPLKPGPGYVRAGKPLVFPTRTVRAATLFPQLDQYRGLPLELGRMEKTVSDPTVWTQMGMRVGLPDAGQLN
ncbi:MAG: amidase, partial [Proteobacteria bacterium]